VEDLGIDPNPINGNANLTDRAAQRARQQWVRANFTQMFDVPPEDLLAQGINPRRYAREHRDQIRRFAQMQRSQGIPVPSGRLSGVPGQGNPGPDRERQANRGYGYGTRGRYGIGLRGSSAWIGILLFLLALRFLLVDSLVGTRAAVVWVLMIGGVILAARVLLFSWLRQRRFNRRRSDGRPNGRPGF
jgi:Flp pilus assembly protein TadB